MSPGCCAGRVLPGVARLLGTYQHILTAGLGCQAAGLPGLGLKANPANPVNPPFPPFLPMSAIPAIPANPVNPTCRHT